MSFGISIYFGLDNSKEENLQLLKQAKTLGFNRIFTSLHIPETNYDILKKEVTNFLKVAKEYNMDIISDISPNTFKFLGLNNLDLKSLKNFGIQTIRIDFGYSEKEIANISRNPYNIKVQLNASTITKNFFNKLDNFNPNYNNIDSLHNFYPRRNTGISEKCLLEKNHLLKEKGIKVSAFVQSNNKKRSPLKDGLPTMEDHRDMSVYLASKHLYALGIDDIFIGDSMPSIKELKDLSSLNKDIIELSMKPITSDKTSLKLLNYTYTSRKDTSRDVIRTNESRLLLENNIIEKEKTSNRPYGSITIDNKDYLRYMGEIQILTTDLPRDERVNVVGNILKEERFLLKYITNNKKFKFRMV
ncbi:DUF871 domain-containing protein [Clostridium oceanicum]|uniref:MupG family TIM beta-alpha barrel fold protein n=1 Tax=Clostridium oceanicum TaxID=1543 RepID=A0ABP3UJG3_9CLOT